jgi:hypothetical protein
VKSAIAGNTLLFHAEFSGAVFHEHVEFLEGTMIEQQFNPLSRCQFALGMLRGNALFTAAKTRRIATPFQLVENVFHGARPFRVCRFCDYISG